MVSSYFLSVKRRSRDTAPADWQEKVLAIEGVRLVGDRDDSILSVEIDDGAVGSVVQAVGKFCHIETETKHRPRGSGTSNEGRLP